MRSRMGTPLRIAALSASLLLAACGGTTGSGGGAGPSPSSASRPSTPSEALTLLNGSTLTDAKCDQTGTSSSANSNGTVVGTCRISKTGSTYSLLQQYSLTLTAQVDTQSRTITSYVSSLSVGANTYYRTGLNRTGGTYATGTQADPHSWSELFFAGATFSNLQQSTVNGTPVWTVDASTPGLSGVTKTGTLYIRATDGFLAQVDLHTASGATVLFTKFGFTAWNTGQPVPATPPQ